MRHIKSRVNDTRIVSTEWFKRRIRAEISGSNEKNLIRDSDNMKILLDYINKPSEGVQKHFLLAKSVHVTTYFRHKVSNNH